MQEVIDFLLGLFDTDHWPARWACGEWTSFHGWLYIFSSFAIAAAYFAIPALLIKIIRQRTDLPFTKLFWGFVAFILVCGATHLIDGIIFWFPVYRLSAVVLFITALVSWGVVLSMRRTIPKVLSLRSVKDLESVVITKSNELSQSHTDLKKLHNDLDTFVYAASHDLKSPINNMEGLLDILKEDISHQQVPAAVIIDKLQDSIHRVQNTISRLTDVIRLEKNPYDDIEILEWHQVLDEVIQENEEVIRISGASITTNFHVKTIEYSRDGLKSILYNLIINAIKYADPSRLPEIEVDTSMHEGKIRLQLHDNGLGIDLEKYRERLFGLFKRLHTHVEGSGIGLYSVKQLVERKGGAVDVRSIVGEGSTFIILF